MTATKQISPRKIKAIRTSHGLSRQDFGESLGVTSAAVSHWENGIRHPSAAVQLLLAKLYGAKK